MYLVQRCFFQDVEVDVNGDIESRKMHDLFHDLAAQIGGKEGVMMTKFPDDVIGKLPPHLLVGEIKDSILQGKGIRSLVSLNTGFVKRELLNGVFSNLTSLRTLNLRHLDVEEIPSSIGKLVHLRYLDLMKCENLKRLPEALSKLQNMLILRLGGCCNLIKLPDDLYKLISLRYLEIKGCDSLNHIPSGLEEMTSLVMLDRLVVNKYHGGLQCLKHLNNLTGSLRIEFGVIGQWKNWVADAEECMLSRKTKLSSLVISFCYLREGEEMLEADVVIDRLQPPNNILNLSVEYFPGVKFPDWVSSLKNLVSLELIHCSSCVEFSHLRQLYQLKTLLLRSILVLEYVVNEFCYDSRSFFPSLESLKVYDMPSLKGWWRPTGEVFYANQLCFPRLSDLIVSHCPQLICLPLCPFVKALMLEGVNVNLATQLLRLPQTRELEANSSLFPPSSSSLQTCSKLNNVVLVGIKDLESLPDEFKLNKICTCLNKVIHQLSSLRYIEPRK